MGSRRRVWAAAARGIAAIAAMAAAGATAQETPLTVWRAARESNAGFLAARAGLNAEREAPPIAFGQLLPNLSLSSSVSRNRVDRSLGGAPEERFEYQSDSTVLSLRQPVYRRYNLALYEQSRAQVDAAEANYLRAGGELAVKVFSAYLDAVFADDVLRLLTAQEATLLAQAAAAHKGFAAGSGTRIDIDEARAKLDLLKAQVIEARNARANAQRALGALIGRSPGTLRPLDPSRLPLPAPREGEALAWVAEAVAKSPELAAARAQIAVAEQEIAKAGAGHLPTLDLVASSGRSGNDSVATLNRAGDLRFQQNVIGLQLSVPIYAGGQVVAGVRQARARLEQAKYQAEEARRNLETAVLREFDSLAQGVTKIRAYEAAEVSAAQVLASTRKGVDAGVRSTLDVLVANQQVFTLRNDLARERYRYLLAQLRLAMLAGRDAEPGLAAISTAF